MPLDGECKPPETMHQDGSIQLAMLQQLWSYSIFQNIGAQLQDLQKNWVPNRNSCRCLMG